MQFIHRDDEGLSECRVVMKSLSKDGLQIKLEAIDWDRIFSGPRDPPGFMNSKHCAIAHEKRPRLCSSRNTKISNF